MKASRRKFRPLLEALDARDVPALLTWMGTYGTSFDYAPNWFSSDGQTRIPHAGDDIEFSIPASGGGGSGGLGGTGTSTNNSADCSGMHGDADPYNSVSLTSTYGGTVTLSGEFTTGGFSVAGGVIRQPGIDITATGLFNWVGGVLNNDSTNPATLHIRGTGWVAPRDSGTLETCDTLAFENAASGTFEAGTITFNGGDGVDVGSDSNVSIQPVPDPGLLDPPELARAVVTFSTGGSVTVGQPKTIIRERGTVTVDGQNLNSTSARSWDCQGVSIENNKGTLRLINQAALNTTFSKVAATYVQNDGKLIAQLGCAFNFSSAMQLKAGQFIVVSQGGETEGHNAVKITGSMTNTGADIVFQRPTPLAGSIPVVGTLIVTGDVTWTGGMMDFLVDAASGAHDWWAIGGKLTTTGDASLKPTFANVPQGGLPAGFKAEAITANGGHAGVMPEGKVTNTPYFRLPVNRGNTWSMFVGQQP